MLHLNLSVLGQLFNITPSPNAFLACGAFAFICLILFLAATLMSFTGA